MLSRKVRLRWQKIKNNYINITNHGKQEIA